MAYYQQPGAYAPSSNQSPQPGYYPPPANQPPPHSYPPNPAMYNQQQPPYPPQQWQQPPGQGQWNQQPQYGQPPPQQWQQQQPYNHSPVPPVQQPGGWGGPPQPGQYQQLPPHQGQYGAQVRPPKSTLGRLKAGMQALTAELTQSGAGNLGEPTAPRGADPRSDAIRIYKAVTGFGTDDRELVLTLAAVQNPGQMLYLRQTYDGMFAHESSTTGGRKDFLKAIEGDVSGDYGELCTTLVRNQAESDAYFVNKAIFRLGTSEDLLNDVLLGRSNYDIHQMKQAYRQIYGKDMMTAVGSDLSAKTKDLFMMVLDDRRPRAEENAPCIPQEIDHDAAELKSAMRSGFGGVGKDTNAVLSIFTKRSDGQIRAINQRYNSMYGNLDKDIKKKFSGQMEDALLLMLRRAVDPIKADADQLEHSMKGLGTNEAVLTNRVVAVHWDKNRLHQVRLAYRQFYNKSLLDRVRGETSMWYKDLLLELLYPGLLENPRLEQKYKQGGE